MIVYPWLDTVLFSSTTLSLLSSNVCKDITYSEIKQKKSQSRRRRTSTDPLVNMSYYLIKQDMQIVGYLVQRIIPTPT
jgi:hypothetical protein